MNARYVHTNLVARDWRALASFYQRLFACAVVPPERDLSGPDIDSGTGIAGARIRGAHLRLPGWGDDGPTLEIFAYEPSMPKPETALNRPGYGHIAFLVGDVPAARAEVLAAGGRALGAVVTITLPTGARIEWCYVTDPEGNAIELQARS
ncbi:MAG: VOC family protein [Chloroflexi bacterium]|nr:VOC family protein [Chloroflexota bacterium]